MSTPLPSSLALSPSGDRSSGSGVSGSIRLTSLLALRPLDLVQIRVRDVECLDRGGRRDWPWRFYQRPLEDGRVEVASAGGALDHVEPGDIVNWRAGTPVKVRALAPAAYRSLMSVPLHMRQSRQFHETLQWHDASVMRLEVDRWGRPDRVWVWFNDPQLNESKVFPARVSDDDHRALVKLTRARAPVCRATGPQGSWFSSDQAHVREQVKTADDARHWLSACLRGDAATAQRLQCVDHNAHTRAGQKASAAHSRRHEYLEDTDGTTDCALEELRRAPRPM